MRGHLETRRREGPWWRRAWWWLCYGPRVALVVDLPGKKARPAALDWLARILSDENRDAFEQGFKVGKASRKRKR